MHPQIRQASSGHCPICGMSLIPEITSKSFSQDPEYFDIHLRFWISFVGTFAIIILELSKIRLAAMGQLVLSFPVIIYGAQPLNADGNH